MRSAWVGVVAVAFSLGLAARGDEKLIVLDDRPRLLPWFRVAPAGDRLYCDGFQKYLVFDASGRLIDQIGVPEGSAPRSLSPLPEGGFLACDSYFTGHLALCRPDGTEARTLVGKGVDETQFRLDQTGATSPFLAVVDPRRKLIFGLDCTIAPRDTPDPDWSRIAVFDFEGQYLRDVNRYDAKAPSPDDAKRTWYDDLAIDPDRQRLYVLARRTHELLAFDYEGKPLGRTAVPSSDDPRGGIAVFPDGRIAAGAGQEVALFRPDLKPAGKLSIAKVAPRARIGDVETDASGRLYASTNDPSVTFLRWSADLKQAEALGPRHLRIEVEFPDAPVSAGAPLTLKVKATGRPEPRGPDRWRVMVRPSDGSDLRWRTLEGSMRGDFLRAAVPDGLRGLYEVAARFGAGPIDRADPSNDPSLQKTIAFVPAGAVRSVAVIADSGRTAFRPGEPIDLHILRKGEGLRPVSVRMELKQGDSVLADVTVAVGAALAAQVPAGLTRRFAPGRYLLIPSTAGHAAYPLTFDIGPAAPDSPLQRVLYHEFAQGATERGEHLTDVAERLAFIRDYARAVHDLGFTRETDRKIGRIDKADGPRAWRRDQVPAQAVAPGLPPAEWLAIPNMAYDWETEAYLDQATRFGIAYDSQLLEHCAGVRFREPWLKELVPVLQRGAQWFRRYPSFYGFNYNDEMFFSGVNGFAAGWTQDDTDGLKQLQTGPFAGRPRADALDAAVRVMYDRFNAAVRQAAPAAKTTATPMWQTPAVEGGYAPNLYRGMDESYSHFLSEGYQPPWYAPHSAEFVRRPGLPLMGVFDNGHSGQGGDLYLKDLMQVVGRGVQGVGVEHTLPFEDARGADAYRVANLLARLYGPIFAEAPPANEAAVLYSRTQDLTEGRNVMGTPHWERVYALCGAGLMAGVPLSIAYEEDLARGWLLDHGKPRVPMLFLVGQTKPPPGPVREQIDLFRAAGGKVFTDADSVRSAGATTLPIHTHALKSALQEGYAADSWSPVLQPIFEALARDLAAGVGKYRRFPMDTDDPWVSKNSFDGGAIRYVLLASETSPYPWDAGTVWSLGAQYNRSYLPKTVALTFPAPSGVVYDVFNQALVKPTVDGKSARLDVDLTTFPGRLYALAPAPLGAPRLVATVADDRKSVAYQIQVVTEDGRPLAARVPVLVRLTHGPTTAVEVVRGTTAQGLLERRLALPATAAEWTLEATELLGGRTSAAVIGSVPPLGTLLTARPAVDPRREAELRGLLKDAKGSITLVTPQEGVLTARQTDALQAALKARGLTLKTDAPRPVAAAPGVVLAAGALEGPLGQGQFADDPLWQAWRRGLFADAVTTTTVPGPGRGFFTAVFAPRADREHVIALVGGDADGLAQTVAAFITWLGAPATEQGPSAPKPGATLTGKPVESAPVPRLRDRVGVKLAHLAIADDGKHLLVGADGYHKNLALVEDQGSQARVVRTARVGQAPTIDSLAIAPDGSWFGAAARSSNRYGQAFHRLDAATGEADVFTAFGDSGRHGNRFAISPKGDIVIAPGTCGVVCWKRDPKGDWREGWALDSWKQFATLDWPVSASAERNPQFHAVIPRDADRALVLFGEITYNGWITAENPSAVWLAAFNLADGKRLWRFDVPLPKTQLFPTLHVSPDGSKTLLQVQMGSWGKESFRFFVVEAGKSVGVWDSRTEPLSVAVSDANGWVAATYKERLLELRRADGTLVISRLWPSQPVSLAFSTDGRGLFVADDSGRLTRLDDHGDAVWGLDLGGVATLAARGGRLYAALWDGRLGAFAETGALRWTLDGTPPLRDAHPMALVKASAAIEARAPRQAARAPTTSPVVPEGENLLRSGKAALTLGGTPGWMSEGKVRITPDALTNGKRDDVNTPWLHIDEVFWDATAGRQVWAEIAFKTPADVRALTVFENPGKPDSWPTAGVVQVWNEATKRWDTAARGEFLNASTNTYLLNLKGVGKLRYVPWDNYYRNFFTSEIEVR